MNLRDIMKWVHKQAINKRRPPSCSIFHAQNHGTILFLKLCNLIIQMTQKTHFLKNQKKVPQKKLGGPGGKAPRQAGKAIKQVNFLLLGAGTPPKIRIVHRFGIDLASIRHRSGIDPDRFGIDLASIWHRFGINLGSIQGPSGTIREPSWTIRESKKHQKSKKSPILISPIAF